MNYKTISNHEAILIKAGKLVPSLSSFLFLKNELMRKADYNHSLYEEIITKIFLPKFTACSGNIAAKLFDKAELYDVKFLDIPDEIDDETKKDILSANLQNIARFKASQIAFGRSAKHVLVIGSDGTIWFSRELK